MLEDPSHSEIVRWGDEGDSFVVLEVSDEPLVTIAARWTNVFDAVRKIYQDHFAKTLQA